MTSGASHDFFATTRWTMVLKAGSESAGIADRDVQAALEELCRIYWFPLYAYARRRNYAKADAEDLTQGFFAQLLQRKDFSRLQAERGRFRAFLLASLKHYLANEYDRAHRLKRGGTIMPLSLDYEGAAAKFEVADKTASPDEIFDREWALALLEYVLERLRHEWMERGQTELFEALKIFLTVEKSTANYDAVATQLGVSEGSLRVAAHRLRKRYRELLKDEISQTLAEPGMVDEELRTLLGVFG
ncbi:MAG: hypothetical protein LBV12_06960 [Puniceicoccales bacterium]|jgi:RNA polymerase sigma-70 factor (ECF subfamily)|nr:hypothetical protein [Puniceicoccales bacterium]